MALNELVGDDKLPRKRLVQENGRKAAGAVERLLAQMPKKSAVKKVP